MYTIMNWRLLKVFYALAFMLANVSCNNGQTKKPQAGDCVIRDKVIGERIDGPANVRSGPNGEVLFSLNDQALVDIGREKKGWHEILLYMDLDSSENNMDSIKAGRLIIIDGEVSGKIIKTHQVSISEGGGTHAMLYGYIHKSNIRTETVIETRLSAKQKCGGRSFDEWKDFISAFDLQAETKEFLPFSGYFFYENAVDDPSPGYRVMLLFEEGELQGIIHSRPLNLKDMETYGSAKGYSLSFYKDYPKSKKQEFQKNLEHWLMSVD
jgi:hypothetical protein